MAGNPNWVKGGASPNPSGRKRLTEAEEVAIKLRAELQPALVKTLANIAMNEKAANSDRITAAKALLHELPKELHLSGEVGRGGSALTPEEMLAIAKLQK